MIPNDYFDIIMANDVIEHILDTDAFFEMVQRKIKNGGHLLLSVPNIRQIRAAYHIFIRGSFPRDEAGLFDKTHLRWFCKKDIIELASNHGFKTIKSVSVGRFVPKFMENSKISEFIALQNIFLMKV